VWYSPNNAVLVLCGAFDADSAFALLESKLGSLPLRAKGVEIRTKEPAQSGERRVELRKEAGLGSVLIGFHIPETSHDDIRAIELLDLILSEGESSRLYRRLVDQDELALRVDCDTDNNFDPGMFEILVQSRESIEGPPIEAAVYEELARVAGEGVSDAELEKARNMLLTDFYREMATISGRADALGSFELFHGGWRELFNISDRYEAVTSEDLQRVTRQYLNANNRTVVTLIPTDTTEAGDRDAR
jgi:zinc protease